MKQIYIIFILVSFLCTNCASIPKIGKTQLQIRAIQTRTYEVYESELVLKVMLNVLQDDGFIVKTAVPKFGLLTATKEIDIEKMSDSMLVYFFGYANARWKKTPL